MIEKVKVTKDGVTKEIQKKDLPQYIAMGWTLYRDYTTPIKQFTRV